MQIQLRAELPGDTQAIDQLLRAAFGGEAESRLVDLLCQGGYVRLSLVATVGDRIVGHILYSPISIDSPGQSFAALALAPMAVLPNYQSRGIGSELVRHSLDLCRQLGHRAVFVLGHPRYYPRFGFSPELASKFASPYAGPAFMALELQAGALGDAQGRVVYAPPFDEL